MFSMMMLPEPLLESILLYSLAIPAQQNINASYHHTINKLEHAIIELKRSSRYINDIVQSERFLRTLLESIFPSFTHYSYAESNVDDIGGWSNSRQQDAIKGRQSWNWDMRRRLLKSTKGGYQFVWFLLFSLTRRYLETVRTGFRLNADGNEEDYYQSMDPLIVWPLESATQPFRYHRLHALSNCHGSDCFSPSSDLMPSRQHRCDSSIGSPDNRSDSDDDSGYSSINDNLYELYGQDYIVRRACCLRVTWKQPTFITSDVSVFLLHPINSSTNESELSANKIWYPPLKRYIFEDLITLASQKAINSDRMFIEKSDCSRPAAPLFSTRQCRMCAEVFPLVGKYGLEPICGTCLHLNDLTNLWFVNSLPDPPPQR